MVDGAVATATAATTEAIADTFAVGNAALTEGVSTLATAETSVVALLGESAAESVTSVSVNLMRLGGAVTSYVVEDQITKATNSNNVEAKMGKNFTKKVLKEIL